MPQGPNVANVAVKTISGGGTAYTPLKVDANGALITSDNLGSETSVYNITAATTLFTGPGVLGKISVVTNGSASGTVNDIAVAGSVAVGNQIAAIGTTFAAGTPLTYDWACAKGCIITPGTGQTLAATFRT